jgi:hypothetical protein
MDFRRLHIVLPERMQLGIAKQWRRFGGINAETREATTDREGRRLQIGEEG